MKIAVIGATGFLGRAFSTKALAQGHSLRILSRRPEQSTGGVEIVRGDTFDPAALRELVRGMDAIVSFAGPPRTGRHDSAPYAAAMESLVAAAEEARVDRLVTVAGAAAQLPGERLGWRRSLLRFVLKRVMPDVIRTKDLELHIVAASGLRWTVLRPPRIGEGRATGKVHATDTDLAGVRLDVEDVADFVLDVLGGDEWVRRAPTLASA